MTPNKNKPTLLRRILDLLQEIFINSGQVLWTEQKLNNASVKQKRIHLFLISFLILFIELICIRWIPANVRYMGFFLNFILLAVFLGIGIGILAGRRTKLWFPAFPIIWFILIFNVGQNVFVLNIQSPDILYYGLSEQISGSERFWILPLTFFLVALTIVPLGRTLGRLLTSLPPLEAYGIDILGSLTGIAAFFLMSYFSLQPIIWFALATIIYLMLRPVKELVFSLPLLIGAIFIVISLSSNSIWSPYYQIRALEVENGTVVTVNGIGHQFITPFQQKENFYFKVYELLGADRVYENVLIIGAGTGSDLTIALNANTQRVTAIEIDPVIHQLGVDLNPDQPYDDPRVRVSIDDGRYYLNNVEEKFDLIVFGLPDSLTLTSGFSSLRLESFLLTSGAMKAAKERLTDDGILVLYNYYREDWLVRKLAGMIESVFLEPPYVTTYGGWGKAAVLISGGGLDGVTPNIDDPFREGFNSSLGENGYLLPVLGEGRLGGDQDLDLTTDDWPFVYMPTRSIPMVFAAALGIVLAISMAMLVWVSPRKKRISIDWSFFFLGVAFMLLETRSLITFALLFGTTWMVNSLVFFAILCSVLLAIYFNAKFKIKNTNLFYGFLFISLLINFVVPTSFFLNIDIALLRYILVSIITFIPIFLSNIIFTKSFRDTQKADIAFGSNLLGAMIGGMLEYLALVTGYQALLIVALLAYLMAYFAFKRGEI